MPVPNGSSPQTWQRLQNKAHYTTGNFVRRTSTCELHVAFDIPYLYDFITQLCR